MLQPALVTIAVPSLNQARYLGAALSSIFSQQVPVEVFVADGGSSDESLSIINSFASQLAGWRSHRDFGQAAAINECIALGHAPYVCWLNSDDMLLPGGLIALLDAIQADPHLAAVYGRAWRVSDKSAEKTIVCVEPFDIGRLSRRCIIAQPATLIRRSAWEAVGGLDQTLRFAMDYDLWWRLYRTAGKLKFVDYFVAIDRDHPETKSRKNRFEHYRESVDVVRRHHGFAPLWTNLVPLRFRWRLAQLRHCLARAQTHIRSH